MEDVKNRRKKVPYIFFHDEVSFSIPLIYLLLKFLFEASSGFSGSAELFQVLFSSDKLFHKPLCNDDLKDSP